jgi:hypothetical protein
MDISIEQLRAYLGANPVPRLSDSAGRPVEMVRDELLIERYLGLIGVKHRYAVDIAASDGIAMSNTIRLFSLFDFSGMAVECDPKKFSELASTYKVLPKVSLARCFVTPDNVLDLLRYHEAPYDVDLFSLDIDSFDYFVLEKVLERYRPRLLICEINEKIPVPLKFSLVYRKGVMPPGGDFYGMSLSMCCELMLRHDYKLIDYNYNNAYFVPKSQDGVPALSPEHAYAQGYRDRSDRAYIFAYNAKFDHLLTLPPNEAMAWLSQVWREYAGLFLLSY